MERTWSVVKFVNDDTVQAIPTSWIIGNICYWPPYTNERLTLAIKKHETHGQNWSTHDIQLFRNSTYADYTIARNKEKRAEIESDLNSDTDGTLKKRKRIQRVYSTEEEEDDEAPSLLITRPPVLKKGLSKTNQFSKTRQVSASAPMESMETTPNMSTYSDVNNSLPQKAHYSNSKNRVCLSPTLSFSADLTEENNGVVMNTTDSSSTTLMPTPTTSKQDNDCFKAYFHQIIRKQNIIQATLMQLVQDVAELKNNYNTNDKIVNESSVFLQFNLPLQDEESVQRFEMFLQEEKNFHETVNEIAKIGGSNAYDVTKRMLTRLISNQVATEYSWFGLKKKKIFGKLLLSKVVIQAGMQALQNSTSKDFELASKNWLRRAKERLDKTK